MPTIVFEGLGYAFAAVAGVVVGVSWVSPRWVYGGEGSLRRVEAFKKAFKECLVLYFFAAVLLLIAAVIEAVTLIFVIQ